MFHKQEFKFYNKKNKSENMKAEELLENEYTISKEEEKILNDVKKIKTEGNAAFKCKEFETSILKYSDALNQCPKKFKTERSILYANRAAAKIALDDSESALDDCNKSLELDNLYQKVYLRRALLLEKLNKLEESLADYEKVLMIDSKRNEAIEGRTRLTLKIQNKNQILKNEAVDKLKSLGNLFLRPFGLSTDNFEVIPNENGSCSINFKSK
uniref:CSON008225 protein n=1 Tax=Culicoides sonorensis TaxID=179676 RepID=A0A336K1X9_CULSO